MSIGSYPIHDDFEIDVDAVKELIAELEAERDKLRAALREILKPERFATMEDFYEAERQLEAVLLSDAGQTPANEVERDNQRNKNSQSL